MPTDSTINTAPALKAYKKETWGDEWEEITYVVVEKIGVSSCLRGVSSCQLKYTCGRHIHHHENEETEETPSGFHTRTVIDLKGRWVKVVANLKALDANGVEMGSAADQILFVGRIEDESRDVMGHDVATGPDPDVTAETVVQTFVAYGPLQLLRKTHISTSWWRITEPESEAEDAPVSRNVELERLDDINSRDQLNLIIGNRTLVRYAFDGTEAAAEDPGSFQYGEAELWSHYDYIEYLLFNFAKAENGPKWKIMPSTPADGSAIDYLKSVAELVELRPGLSIADTLALLVSDKYGMDYRITYTADTEDPADDWFTIEPFWLLRTVSPEDFGISSDPLPFPYNDQDTILGNPNGMVIDAVPVGIVPRIQFSDQNKYARIRIEGKPVVVCASLFGKKHEGFDESPSCVPKWDQTELESGSGSVSSGSSTDITFAEEAASPPSVTVTFTTGSGSVTSITTTGFTVENTSATLGATFNWRAGGLEIGYLGGAVGEFNGADEHDAARKSDVYRPVFQQYGANEFWDFMEGLAKPVVGLDGNVVEQTEESEPGDYIAEAQRFRKKVLHYIPLKEGTDYSVDPPVDVILPGKEPDYLPPMALIFKPEDPEAIPNGPGEAPGRFVSCDEEHMHVSASQTDWGLFIQANPNHALALNHFDDAAETNQPALFDYETLVITFAFEADVKIKMEFATGEEDDGSVLVITDLLAELWFIAAGTVVGIAGDGTIKKLGSETGLVVRNDRDRLLSKLLGAIARYMIERAYAELQIGRIADWTTKIGHLITSINDGAGAVPISSPITSVEFNPEQQKTIVKTGYAR